MNLGSVHDRQALFTELHQQPPTWSIERAEYKYSMEGKTQFSQTFSVVLYITPCLDKSSPLRLSHTARLPRGLLAGSSLVSRKGSPDPEGKYTVFLGADPPEPQSFLLVHLGPMSKGITSHATGREVPSRAQFSGQTCT